MHVCVHTYIYYYLNAYIYAMNAYTSLETCNGNWEY